MWREWVPIVAFSDWMFGTRGMPVKRDYVCYSTQPLGWNIGTTINNAHVIKGIRLCVCGHHDHSDVEAVTNALHTYQRAAGSSLNLIKSNPYHWAYGILPMRSIPWALLTYQHRKFLASDSMRLSRRRPVYMVFHCNTQTELTALARLHDVNLLQHVRYVNICQLWRML